MLNTPNFRRSQNCGSRLDVSRKAVLRPQNVPHSTKKAVSVWRVAVRFEWWNIWRMPCAI